MLSKRELNEIADLVERLSSNTTIAVRRDYLIELLDAHRKAYPQGDATKTVVLKPSKDRKTDD